MLVDVSGINKNSKNPVFQNKVSFESGKEVIVFEVTITVQDDVFLVDGISESEVTLECSRCLAPAKVTQRIAFNDLFLKNKSDFERYEENFPGNIFFVENGKINLADSIAAALEEQEVTKVLCSEECQGLCPGCGTNLNIAKCNCKDENIDPRLEALKNFKV